MPRLTLKHFWPERPYPIARILDRQLGSVDTVTLQGVRDLAQAQPSNPQ
ncbi:MAG: hypothetical protein VKJ06_04605 [Vampirovibrionales bacterium]|nr:hypothetical protein [Vampirovibrionales bacterium]